MRPKLVEIAWRDSMNIHGPQWWSYQAAMDEPCPDVMISSGYVFKEDRHYVWLAGDCHVVGDGTATELGRLFLIPKGCIVKRRLR